MLGRPEIAFPTRIDDNLLSLISINTSDVNRCFAQLLTNLKIRIGPLLADTVLSTTRVNELDGKR